MFIRSQHRLPMIQHPVPHRVGMAVGLTAEMAKCRANKVSFSNMRKHAHVHLDWTYYLLMSYLPSAQRTIAPIYQIGHYRTDGVTLLEEH